MQHCRNSLCGRESSLRAVNENPPIEPVGHLARPTDGLTDPRWIYALNRPDMLFDRIGAVQPSLGADHPRETKDPPESLGLSRMHRDCLVMVSCLVAPFVTCRIESSRPFHRIASSALSLLPSCSTRTVRSRRAKFRITVRFVWMPSPPLHDLSNA